VSQFPDTHWSQILEIGDPAHPRHAEHLERLVHRYWKPLYYYVRAMRDVSAGDAEDVTQDFFEMLLRRADFAALSPDRGSFRGFLKTALRRFVVSAERKRVVRETQVLRFGELDRGWIEIVRSGHMSPDEAFDRAWARDVLEEMMSRIKAALEIENKAKLFEIFREYTLDGAGLTYEGLAEKHGMSLDDIRNGLRSVRERGREILNDILRDYLFPGENLEAELKFILSRK
jgi:RNA polymerase sigma factor (sigma-70 family)